MHRTETPLTPRLARKSFPSANFCGLRAGELVPRPRVFALPSIIADRWSWKTDDLLSWAILSRVDVIISGRPAVSRRAKYRNSCDPITIPLYAHVQRIYRRTYRTDTTADKLPPQRALGDLGRAWASGSQSSRIGTPHRRRASRIIVSRSEWSYG